MSLFQRCAVRFGRAAQHKPSVSLCVPVYGTEGLVGRFLDSVLRQEAAPLFETIIVNDGSPGTKELRSIVKIYTKRFKERGLPLVFLEHGKNLGTLEARRTAANAASGEYLTFVDPDDELPPDADTYTMPLVPPVQLLCMVVLPYLVRKRSAKRALQASHEKHGMYTKAF